MKFHTQGGYSHTIQRPDHLQRPESLSKKSSRHAVRLALLFILAVIHHYPMEIWLQYLPFSQIPTISAEKTERLNHQHCLVLMKTVEDAMRRCQKETDINKMEWFNINYLFTHHYLDTIPICDSGGYFWILWDRQTTPEQNTRRFRCHCSVHGEIIKPEDWK